MKIIDRKRAPALQEERPAQLPAREVREGILARARAAVAGKTQASPQRAQSVRPRPGVSQSPRSGPVRNLPAVVNERRGVPARPSSRSAPAVPRRGDPARQGQSQPSPGPAAASVQRMDVPPGQGAAAVQNSGSGQTIIVQVSTPQPSYPWWGPWWWGYSPAGCGARSCPRRVGQVCTRWLCGW